MKFLFAFFFLLHFIAQAQTPAMHIITEEYQNLDSLLITFKGKVVYIDFWASWCRPCLEEMPYSRKLQEEFAGKDVIFLFLAYRDKAPAWKAKMEQLQVPGYHFLLSPKLNAEARQKFGITAIPHFAMIRKNGKIAYVQALPPSFDETAKDLRKLLEE